jgi:hypothetical protein
MEPAETFLVRLRTTLSLPFPMHKVSAIPRQFYEAYYPWHTNMELERILVSKASPIVVLIPLRSNRKPVDFGFCTDVGKYRVAQ